MRVPVVYRSLVTLGVCLVAAVEGPVAAQRTSERHPDLTGEWVLNRDLSTDAHQMGEGRQGRAAGGAPEGRGGPGGGSPRGFGGGMRGGVPGEPGRGAAGDEGKMREQMEAGSAPDSRGADVDGAHLQRAQARHGRC